jgi:transcriptional regulator with XRE-family HTH domain
MAKRESAWPPAELRAWRKTTNLTQKGLAAKLGVTANTVARWERGEQPIPRWVRLQATTEQQFSAEFAKAEARVTDAQMKAEARLNEARTRSNAAASDLRLQIERLKAEHAKRLSAADDEIRRVKKQVRDWRTKYEALKASNTRDSFSRQSSAGNGDRAARAHAIMKRFAKSYHPDLDPRNEEIMKDFNELYQALRPLQNSPAVPSK